MTHDQLVIIAEKWLRKRCGVVFTDKFKAANIEQPDAIGFRSSTSIMVECKTSRADFLRDRRKGFRSLPKNGMGDWRFYLCPPLIITPDDLPDGWGLLYADNGKVVPVVGIPGNCDLISKKPFTGNKTAEFQLLYSALRKIAVSGHL